MEATVKKGEELAIKLMRSTASRQESKKKKPAEYKENMSYIALKGK